MSLTAFIPTGAPQILPFIGTPGAGTVGHALVWSQSPQGFTLSPIAVGPDQFSGVLPIAKGGTGSNNGSITGTGALTFAAGGTNQNVTLSPSGTGIVSCGNTVVGPGSRFGDSPLTLGRASDPTNRTNTEGRRLVVENNVASNNGSSDYVIFAANRARGTLASPQTTQVGDRVFGFFAGARGPSSWQNYSAGFQFEVDGFVAGEPEQRILFYTGGTGDVPFRIFPRTIAIYAVAESTSTTNGACTIAGGLGVAKNVNIGGGIKVSGAAINFANLPDSSSGLAVGDLWRDGETIKIKL